MSKIGIQTHGVNQSIMRKNLRGGGIAKRGTGVALKTGGRAALRFGGGRTNLLEELGRVEGEHSNRNRRDEIARVHSELNRGYAKGGRAGFSAGREVGKHLKKLVKKITHEVPTGPHTDVRRRELNKKWQRKKLGVSPEMKATLKGLRGKSLRNTHKRDVPTMAAEGGRIGFKKGTDKNWIQKATASIKKRGTKGKCTPITKPGCTGRAKALAKTFKKMAAKRKA
jgi:hypothetical protein